MEISELKSFAVLAKELHFGRASSQLFLSQPALSKQIRRLESKVGGALFARTRRKVELTEAGRVLLPHAEKVLREAERALAVSKQWRVLPARCVSDSELHRSSRSCRVPLCAFERHFLLSDCKCKI